MSPFFLHYYIANKHTPLRDNTWPAAKYVIWSIFKKTPIEFQEDIATIQIHRASFGVKCCSHKNHWNKMY